MTADMGFLFSVVAVNMSLASLAGLVIAFRRTGVWATHDLYRLRQIVEWGFANVVLALLGFPVAGLVGQELGAFRVVSAIALAYVVLNLIVLQRRRVAMPALIRLTPLIAIVDVSLLLLATASVIVASVTSWEIVLLLLTARPMIAFLLVLATLGREEATN